MSLHGIWPSCPCMPTMSEMLIRSFFEWVVVSVKPSTAWLMSSAAIWHTAWSLSAWFTGNLFLKAGVLQPHQLFAFQALVKPAIPLCCSRVSCLYPIILMLGSTTSTQCIRSMHPETPSCRAAPGRFVWAKRVLSKLGYCLLAVFRVILRYLYH